MVYRTHLISFKKYSTVSLYGYTIDLTKEEFSIIQPLLPKSYIQARPPKLSKQQILNGVFYQLVNGCRWVDLPKDLPPVFYWFNK